LGGRAPPDTYPSRNRKRGPASKGREEREAKGEGRGERKRKARGRG